MLFLTFITFQLLKIRVLSLEKVWSTLTDSHPDAAPVDTASAESTHADPAHGNRAGADVPRANTPDEDTALVDASHDDGPHAAHAAALDSDVHPTDSAHGGAGVADDTLSVVALSHNSVTQSLRTQMPLALADSGDF